MNYLFIYLAMVLGAFCTLIAMTVMRRGETHNVGKFGWLFLTLLTPPVGLILFLWLGGKKISAEHHRRDLVDLEVKDSHCDRAEADVRSSIAQIGVQRGLPGPSDQNRLSLLDTPEELEKGLFKLIDSASERLFIQSFAMLDDEIGNRVVDRLCDKAREGVEVRLMVDGFGSFAFPTELLKQVRQAGGHAVRFKPLTKPSRFAYLNFRNHRKIVVADGARAMLGGANLVEYQITQQPDDDTWIDCSLRIDGLCARQNRKGVLVRLELCGRSKSHRNRRSHPVTRTLHRRRVVRESGRYRLYPLGPTALRKYWMTCG